MFQAHAMMKSPRLMAIYLLVMSTTGHVMSYNAHEKTDNTDRSTIMMLRQLLDMSKRGSKYIKHTGDTDIHSTTKSS